MNARTRARLQKRKLDMAEMQRHGIALVPAEVSLPPEDPPTKKPPAPADLLTSQQVQAWLQVSEQWLDDHRTRVEPIIPHFKIGNLIRYSRGEIEEWLLSHRKAS